MRRVPRPRTERTRRRHPNGKPTWSRTLRCSARATVYYKGGSNTLYPSASATAALQRADRVAPSSKLSGRRARERQPPAQPRVSFRGISKERRRRSLNINLAAERRREGPNFFPAHAPTAATTCSRRWSDTPAQLRPTSFILE
ncbi:hypothetical protein MTO96_002588 [Rhipicephalus appendiculatus]